MLHCSPYPIVPPSPKCFGRSKLSYRGCDWKNLPSPSDRLASDFWYMWALLGGPFGLSPMQMVLSDTRRASVFYSFLSDGTFFLLASEFRKYFFQLSLAIMAFLLPRCFSPVRIFFSIAIREVAISGYWGISLRAPSLNTLDYEKYIDRGLYVMYCQLMQNIGAHCSF